MSKKSASTRRESTPGKGPVQFTGTNSLLGATAPGFRIGKLVAESFATPGTRRSSSRARSSWSSLSAAVVYVLDKGFDHDELVALIADVVAPGVGEAHRRQSAGCEQDEAERALCDDDE